MYDSPSLEEACLWADLAEVAEERDQARAERDQARSDLAGARAEIDRLRAELASRQRPARVRRPARVG